MSGRRVLVDHVLIVSHDAGSTCSELEERTGLRSVPGGQHQGLGTRNQIVPLGGGFLEILEIHDPELAALNPFGKLALAGLADATARGRLDSLAAWSTVVADIRPASAGMSGPVLHLTREGVSALLTGVEEATVDPSRPFYLQRGPSDADPGQRAAGHLHRPVGFARLTASRARSADQWQVESIPTGTTEFDIHEGDRSMVLTVEINLQNGAAVLLSSDCPTGVDI